MTIKLIGLCASLSLVAGGAAFAGGQQRGSATQGSESKPSMDSQQKADPHAGMHPGSTTMLQGSEIVGEVAKVEAKILYVRHMGAIVPLKISRETKLDGKSFSRKDLKEGQEIRASFTVENLVNNVATTITTTDPGTGGAGSVVPRHRELDDATLPAEPERAPMPEEPGTGTSPSPGSNY